MRNKERKYVDYSDTLTAAGAKVIDYSSFGSYQGTWLALVEYNGEKGIVEGYYGSCSHCDALQSEFDEWAQPFEKEGKYYKDYGDEEITKDQYDEYWEDLEIRMKNFGEQYLKQGMNTKEYYQKMLENLNEDDWFDSEKQEYCKWAIDRL